MIAKCKTPKQVLAFAKAQGAQFVDFKFVDLPGTWQHFSAVIDELDEGTFAEGIGFDGSSIRGFQAIHESDMLLFPDPTTAHMDPFTAAPTLSLVCTVRDPLSGEAYSRDPRHIAQKAVAYLAKSGLGEISYWGPEAEFFVFDSVSYEQNQWSAHYAVDQGEAIWNSGKPGLGHNVRWKEGYFPVSPGDTLQDLRSEMVSVMLACGIPVEVHHHEVATAGQCEIDMRFDSLVSMADSLLLYKYIVKNVAKRHGKTATFMPKPLWGDNGSGMHVHQSIWKDGVNLFFDKKGYALLSKTALYYIGGLLKHAPALLAICAPTVNSYHRLVPGFEAPVNIAYSRRNRSAAVRIPMYSTNPKTKRIEFRCPDPSTNPYLAFSAMLLAGLDGIRNKIDPGDPADFDIYEAHNAGIKQVPGSLAESLAALEADHRFLLEGEVFTPDVIETWVAMKRSKEIDPIRLRPHPYEYLLYYDA